MSLTSVDVPLPSPWYSSAPRAPSLAAKKYPLPTATAGPGDDVSSLGLIAASRVTAGAAAPAGTTPETSEADASAAASSTPRRERRTEMTRTLRSRKRWEI